MIKINKYLILVLLFVTILSFSACSSSTSYDDKNKINQKIVENKINLKKINISNLSEIKLEISGMTCEGCSYGVEAVVGGLPGVESAKVDYKSGIGIVKYDPDIINITEIVNASNDLYPTKVFNAFNEQKNS